MIWMPKRPENLEEAKLTPYFIRDHILKVLYTRGTARGVAFSEALRLPYALIDAELRHLRENDLLTPVGGAGIGGYDGMDFSLTELGQERAHGVFSRSPYTGPAPVEIRDYFDSVQMQRFPSRWIKKAHLEGAFADIVLSLDYLKKLGPAINSGGPLFLYGKPGNGKTTIAERLARVFKQGIFVPYTVQVDGQYIQLLDEKVHRRIPIEILPEDHPVRADPRSLDSRWVFVFRPFIIVGGELTLAMLDLTFHEGQDSYEAPFQMKANGGVLLVDDFGRQIVKPKDFLNRWIFPLEKGVDFLTFVNGKKIEVPFEQILIFSTNLDPQELADEAFWRRIRYKLEIPSPTEKDYKRIFQAVCTKIKLAFDETVYQHLIEKHYKQAGRELRAVHPRDILSHALDHIAYNGLEPKLTAEVLDLACPPYFANFNASPPKKWATME